MKDYKELVAEIQKLAEANPASELVFLNSVLESLSHGGFSSARFYEIVKDPIEDAEVLVLRAYSYPNQKANPRRELGSWYTRG